MWEARQYYRLTRESDKCAMDVLVCVEEPHTTEFRRLLVAQKKVITFRLDLYTIIDIREAAVMCTSCRSFTVQTDKQDVFSQLGMQNKSNVIFP